LNLIGEISALATALAFAVSSVFHTLAGRRIGSVNVNRDRLLLAVIYLLCLNLVLGNSLPPQTDLTRLFWLGISGAIGLALGDALLFQSFVLVGARLGMLLMALAPVITSLLGWIFFKERLDLINMIGIMLAVSGVLVVVQDRGKGSGDHVIPPKEYLDGILFGLGAAVCQAVGLVTARPGMDGNFPPLSGALIRMSVAAVIIWGIAIFQKQVRQTFKQTDRKSWGFLALGALVGPTLGVTLSLFAVQNTAIGIASTLIAMTPVFLLPIGYFFFKELFGWGAVIGTLLAMLGVTMILIG